MRRMKKLLCIVITLSIVMTMLVSVTAFATNLESNLLSTEAVSVKNSAGVKFREADSTASYGTTAITNGSDVEVVTSATGNSLRKLQLEGTKDKVAEDVGYTVIEFTINTPHTVNTNGNTNTSLARMEVYLQNFGSSTSVRAYIGGTGAWKTNQNNKVHVVVAWNEGEMYTYANGYMKQAIEVPFSKDAPKNARRVNIETKYGADTTAEYPLYELKDYSIKHYSDFDPSWLGLSVVKYSHGWVESTDNEGNDTSDYKYSIETAVRGYRTSKETLTNEGNTAYQKGELIFAAYDKDGKLSAADSEVSIYNSGTARTSYLATEKAEGEHKLFFFLKDKLSPVFSRKFFNALPME